LRECESEAAARGCLAPDRWDREHFEVEERVLFSLAAKRLSVRATSTLGEAGSGTDEEATP